MMSGERVIQAIDAKREIGCSEERTADGQTRVGKDWLMGGRMFDEGLRQLNRLYL